MHCCTKQQQFQEKLAQIAVLLNSDKHVPFLVHNVVSEVLEEVHITLAENRIISAAINFMKYIISLAGMQESGKWSRSVGKAQSARL